MAQLFRVANHRDSTDGWTFTFLLPSTVVSPNAPTDVISRELLYAGNRWRVHVTRRDGTHLCPSLELLNCTQGLSCTLDYGFTLINQDSYTQNERFVEKQREFNASRSRHGSRTFIQLEDLTKRLGFFGAKHDLILELTVRSACTVVKTHLRLSDVAAGQIDCRRYDADGFQYGMQEWRAVFCPNMDSDEEQSSRNRHLIQLQRVNKSETMCRMRYAVTLGNQKPQFESKLRDELFDFSGSGEGIYFSEDYRAFTDVDVELDCLVLPITIHLRSSTFVSHVKLSLIGETDDPKKDALATVFVDKDRQSWRAVAHSAPDDTLAITVLYQDLRNVPAGYLRYVCWTCKVLSVSGYTDKSQLVDNCPLENFYVQNAQSDRGVCMSTKMSIKQILAADSVWLNRADGRLTVEIDWLASHLLVQPTYNAYDHVLRRHAMQMRREVDALQAENYSLEREMHTYQQSIANKCSSSINSRAPSQAPSLTSTPVAEPNPLLAHNHSRHPAHHRGSTGSVHSTKSIGFSSTQSPRRVQPQEHWRDAQPTAADGRRASDTDEHALRVASVRVDGGLQQAAKSIGFSSTQSPRRVQPQEHWRDAQPTAADGRRASDTDEQALRVASVRVDGGLQQAVRSPHHYRNNVAAPSTVTDDYHESLPSRPYGESPRRQRRPPSPSARSESNSRRYSAYQTSPIDEHERTEPSTIRRSSANYAQLTDTYEPGRSPLHRSPADRNRIDRSEYPEDVYSAQRPHVDRSLQSY